MAAEPLNPLEFLYGFHAGPIGIDTPVVPGAERRRGDLADIESAGRVEAETVRGGEAAGGEPIVAPERHQLFTVSVPDADLRGSIDRVALTGQSDASLTHEQLTDIGVAVAVEAEIRGPRDVRPHLEQGAIDLEDLDAVVLAVADVHPIARIDPQAVHEIELSPAPSPAHPRTEAARLPR